MRLTIRRFAARLAGAAAASGLALAGLVAAATPASAAACSGTTGVTVVVDTGSSTSTSCASGDPSSALKALSAAGFRVTYPQAYPGSVVCRINGYPTKESDPCVRMPPGNAYWAFFHAKRGGSWAYSSSGVGSYDPAPGSVVGFRFGSGQQPRTAPPARTSTPTPTKTTAKPKPTKTASAPKPTTPTKTAAPSATAGTGRDAGPKRTTTAAATPSATPSSSGTASASASPPPSATGTPSASPSETASDVAVEPTSAAADDGNGPGTLIAGGALVALVAGGAGWAAWKRRT